MNRGLNFLIAHRLHADKENCVLWPYGVCTPGYGMCFVDGRRQMTHRVMCTWVKGHPPTPKHQVAHSCGNRRCINPHHLSWKTAAQNQIDRNAHGMQTVVGRTKITKSQVEQIKALKGVETSVHTAAKYGITESNVRLIQDGKIWNQTGRSHAMLLTRDQVIAVRNSEKKKSCREVGEAMGIHEDAVWRIRRGISYRHFYR